MPDPQDLTAPDVVRQLADPRRLRVLAAVVLGADDVATAAGVPVREAAAALHRLQAQGLVEQGPDGPRVAYERLQQLAASGREDSGEAGPLSPFVRGRHLVSLPAQPRRRAVVLAHVAEQVFERGVDYDEPAVNALLAPWCEGGEVDHAALRRYLVESGLLSRGGGVYRRGGPPVEPGLAERRVQALGLS